MIPQQDDQETGTNTPPNPDTEKGHVSTPPRSEHSKTRISSQVLDHEDQEARDERLRNIGREMRFHWVGPMEPETFLDTFLSPKAEKESDFADSVAEPLRRQLDSWVKDLENVFTPKLCDALNAIFVGRFIFEFTGLSHSLADKTLNPDVTVYHFGNGPETNTDDDDDDDDDGDTRTRRRCDFKKCFMNFECKSGTSPVDVFNDNPGKYDLFASETSEALKARGQIVGPTRNTLSFQQRCCVYSVFISPRMARLILCDRSGGIFTRQLNLTQLDGVKLLLRFLSRLCTDPASSTINYAVQVARGIDPTFKKASKRDAEAFRRWERAPKDKVRPWRIDPKADVFEITDSKNRRYLFSAEPVVSPRLNILIRGSRIFYGKDANSNMEVVMKDIWRIDLPGFHREHDTYEKLKRDPAVEGLPEVLDAYDVDGQSTRVSLEDNRTDLDAGLAPDAKRIELAPHVHYRMFFKTVGRRLSLSWVSSRQLVEFVYQVTKTLWEAYDKKKILHQDVSEGNVLITPEGRAILTDWEMCTNVPPAKLPRRSERTGTWQYMSAMLLLKRPPLGAPPGHALPDDLESCFYLLLREVLLHLPVVGYISGTEMEDLKANIEEIFNQTTYHFSQRKTSGGGAKKLFFLNPDGETLRIEGNPPLTQLIADARKFFRPRYHADLYESEEGRTLVRSKYKSAVEFLKIFERALNSPGWPSGKDKLKNLHDRIRDRQKLLRGTITRDTNTRQLEVIVEQPMVQEANEHSQQANEPPQQATETIQLRRSERSKGKTPRN